MTNPLLISVSLTELYIFYTIIKQVQVLKRSVVYGREVNVVRKAIG